MRLDRLWIVTNPGRHDTLADICHEEPMDRLPLWIVGASAGRTPADWRKLGVAYYTEEHEAVSDANERLQRREGPPS